MMLAAALALLLSVDPIIVVPRRTDAPAVVSERYDGEDSVFMIDLPGKKKYRLKFECGVNYTVPMVQLEGPSVTEVHLKKGGNIRNLCVLLSWTAR